jgi:hypothetical protein
MLTTVLYRVWKVHNSDVFRNELRGVCVFTQTNIYTNLVEKLLYQEICYYFRGWGDT